LLEKNEMLQKDDMNTVFGRQSLFDGEITTKGSIRVEGEITGTINADGNVFIGETGQIHSDIEGCEVVIGGKVEGDIIARNKLTILKTGILKGDIKAKKLEIEEGARFIGKSSPLLDDEKEADSDIEEKNI